AGTDLLQVIQQRVMIRDNILAIMDKYEIFADRRDSLSWLLELVKENTRFKRSSSINRKDPKPARPLPLHRTNRATETTKFLAREVQDRGPDLASVESRISE